MFHLWIVRLSEQCSTSKFDVSHIYLSRKTLWTCRVSWLHWYAGLRIAWAANSFLLWPAVVWQRPLRVAGLPALPGRTATQVRDRCKDWLDCHSLWSICSIASACFAQKRITYGYIMPMCDANVLCVWVDRCNTVIGCCVHAMPCGDLPKRYR